MTPVPSPRSATASSEPWKSRGRTQGMGRLSNPDFAIDVQLARRVLGRIDDHEFFELIYVKTGRLELYMDGEIRSAAAGDMFVVANRPYSVYAPCNSDPEYMSLAFSERLIREYEPAADSLQYLMPFLDQQDDRPFVIPGESGVPDQARQLIEKMFTLLPASDVRRKLTVRTYLKMLLVLIGNHYADSGCAFVSFDKRQRDLNRLQPVFEFVEHHYSDPISVTDAASVVHMSKSHFTRFFKLVSGQPFVTHLNGCGWRRRNNCSRQATTPSRISAMESDSRTKATLRQSFAKSRM